MEAMAGRRTRQIQHALRLEIIHLRLEGRHDRRTHSGFRATDADGTVQPTKTELS